MKTKSQHEFSDREVAIIGMSQRMEAEAVATFLGEDLAFVTKTLEAHTEWLKTGGRKTAAQRAER